MADNDEWGTPAYVLDLTRQVLGGIDTDPASNAAAQQVVRAERYYTRETNGLAHPWLGRVWLNPPYSMPLIAQFVDKLFEELEAGRVTAAVVLVNNATETKWHTRLALELVQAHSRKRLQFVHPDGRPTGSNRQAQTFFYFGPEPVRFYRVFDPIAYPPMGALRAVAPLLKLADQST